MRRGARTRLIRTRLWPDLLDAVVQDAVPDRRIHATPSKMEGRQRTAQGLLDAA